MPIIFPTIGLELQKKMTKSWIMKARKIITKKKKEQKNSESLGNYVTCHRSTRVKITLHKVYACQQLGPDARFLDSSLKEFQAAASQRTKMN
jgi:hypothetical protein